MFQDQLNKRLKIQKEEAKIPFNYVPIASDLVKKAYNFTNMHLDRHSAAVQGWVHRKENAGYTPNMGGAKINLNPKEIPKEIPKSPFKFQEYLNKAKPIRVKSNIPSESEMDFHKTDPKFTSPQTANHENYKAPKEKDPDNIPENNKRNGLGSHTSQKEGVRAELEAIKEVNRNHLKVLQARHALLPKGTLKDQHEIAINAAKRAIAFAHQSLQGDRHWHHAVIADRSPDNNYNNLVALGKGHVFNKHTYSPTEIQHLKLVEHIHQ